MEWRLTQLLLLLSLIQSMSLLAFSQEDTATCSTINNLTCSNFCPTRLCSRMCLTKTTPLYIQGFVPADNAVFTSEGIVPAAYVAIDEINANCSILPNYRLELAMANTKCDASESTWQLINAIVLNADTAQPKIMFLGGGCSPATEPLAALSGRFYNVTQISYGASSPTLSDREMFPRFFRTIPSEVQSNLARFALMKKYNWKRVATLHETRNIFSQTVEDFHTQYKRIFTNNDTSDSADEEENLILRSFTDDPEIPLRQIMEKDIRIILGYFYENKAVKTLCQAYHMNLTTANHLWMFPAWFEAGWWNTSYPLEKDNITESSFNCTREQMQTAVKNSLFLDSHNFGLDPTATTKSGTTNATFFEKFNCYLEDFINSSCLAEDSSTFHFYSTFTYDAVYSMAYALDGAEEMLQAENLNLTDFQYNNTMNISEYIANATRDLEDFLGVSGDLRFDINGTRIGLNAIYQLQEDNSTGTLKLVPLAIHDPSPPEGGDNCDFNFTIDPQFSTDDGEPPRDRRRPVNKYLNNALVIVCGVVTGIAIAIALALLVFNLVTIRKPLIRDSAPIINTIVIVGCLVVLVSCFLLGVDSRTPAIDDYVTDDNNEDIPENELEAVQANRNERYQIICIVRLWLLTLGFTLSFGALFAKTWQVYRIYTNPKLKKEPFKMWNFLIIISIFLVIDLAYLSFWTGAPSPNFRFTRGRVQQQDEDNDLELFYERCECNHFGYLIGALYVYKGLLVVFGLFLAYESRNVKYHYINDSRFVSIAMYIVVIVVGIGAPLSLVLAVHFFIDAAYALAVLMIIGSTMACLLILFIPKFVYMAKGEETMIRENSREEITVSDGLQLGKSSMDQNDIRTAEDEVDALKQQVCEREIELKELEDVEAGTATTALTEPIPTPASSSSSSSGGGAKPRSGSDNDSGVGVTVDETETFSTESTNGENHRAGSSQLEVLNTPSPANEDDEDEEEEEEEEENTAM